MSNYAKYLLRFEGGLVGALAIWIYATQIGNWWLFALLILTPDLSALGYLKDKKTGAFTYNTVHSYIVPALLAAATYFLGFGWLTPYFAIWFAHIGIDRLVGYGMKFPTDHKRNHLN